MKNIQSLILYGIILLGCFSCKKEGELTPNAPLPNLFAPAEGATDPTSELRRAFYKETGCYLLFTDTLKNEYAGTDVYGNPLYQTELLDLTYGITSSVRWKFAFTNLSEYEKKEEAVELIREYFFPVFRKDDYPYSFLLVNDIVAYAWRNEDGTAESEGEWSEAISQPYYFGERAMAISISELQARPETIVQWVRMDLIENYLSADKLQAFYAFGREYYGEYYVSGFYSEEEFLSETGILAYDEYDDWDEAIYGVGGMGDDLGEYLEAILDRTEEDFKEEYGDYDAVIRKYDMLKQLLLDGGFNI